MKRSWDGFWGRKWIHTRAHAYAFIRKFPEYNYIPGHELRKKIRGYTREHGRECYSPPFWSVPENKVFVNDVECDIYMDGSWGQYKILDEEKKRALKHGGRFVKRLSSSDIISIKNSLPFMCQCGRQDRIPHHHRYEHSYARSLYPENVEPDFLKHLSPKCFVCDLKEKASFGYDKPGKWKPQNEYVAGENFDDRCNVRERMAGDCFLIHLGEYINIDVLISSWQFKKGMFTVVGDDKGRYLCTEIEHCWSCTKLGPVGTTDIKKRDLPNVQFQRGRENDPWENKPDAPLCKECCNFYKRAIKELELHKILQKALTILTRTTATKEEKEYARTQVKNYLTRHSGRHRSTRRLVARDRRGAGHPTPSQSESLACT